MGAVLSTSSNEAVPTRRASWSWVERSARDTGRATAVGFK